MSADEYLCPVCSKPFDKKDRLFDFAVASHEKEHRPEYNNPANMITYDDDSLMWLCKLCDHPLHIGEYTARQMVISHCRQKHGSLTASATPVTARGGNSGGRRSGFGRSADTISDVAEDIIGVIGGVIGSALSKLLDP